SNAVNPEGKPLSRIATEGLSDSERIHLPSFTTPIAADRSPHSTCVPFGISPSCDILSTYQDRAEAEQLLSKAGAWSWELVLRSVMNFIERRKHERAFAGR